MSFWEHQAARESAARAEARRLAAAEMDARLAAICGDCGELRPCLFGCCRSCFDAWRAQEDAATSA